MFESLRAARLYGRSEKSVGVGANDRALDLLEKALQLLYRPGVDRQWPPTYSLILVCTRRVVTLLEASGRAAQAREHMKQAIAVYDEGERSSPTRSAELKGWRDWAEAKLRELDNG
jgi:hypothetical protein